MQAVSLKVTKRNQGEKAVNEIPGVCYGAGKDNVLVSIEYQPFRKLYMSAGENTVIDLDVDGIKHKALVHDIQKHPVSDQTIHVDFKFIRMDEKVIANIPVVFDGEAPAVKDLQGILTPQMHDIEVRCLPGDLPHEFRVDISGIVDFHTIIHVKDLKFPSGVEVLTDLELAVVNVVPPKVEEEITAEAEAAKIAELGAEPEKIEGAEGEASKVEEKKEEK